MCRGYRRSVGRTQSVAGWKLTEGEPGMGNGATRQAALPPDDADRGSLKADCPKVTIVHK